MFLFLSCSGKSVDDTAADVNGSFFESSGGSWLSVSAGWEHSCGLSQSGVIECWGCVVDKIGNEPCEPPSSEYGYTALDGSVETGNCALSEVGRVDCWGDWLLTEGVDFSDLPTLTSVSVGYDAACSLTSDNDIVCWGEGRGVNDEYPRPPELDGVEIVTLDVGASYECAIDDGGQLLCWGYMGYGMDELTSRSEAEYVDISIGLNHLCAVRRDGGLECWGGYNNSGELDAPAGDFVSVGVGNRFSCAIDTDGGLSCWGEDEYGLLEPPDGSFSEVSLGSGHACAIRDDGHIVCWGSENIASQLP